MKTIVAVRTSSEDKPTMYEFKTRKNALSFIKDITKKHPELEAIHTLSKLPKNKGKLIRFR